MRFLLYSLMLNVMVYLGGCAPAQAYEPSLHLADWQVARMSPEAFVERYTRGRESYPGSGGLYRNAMAHYNACLHRNTARQAHRLPSVLRRQFRDVSTLADAWHDMYYLCGWSLCPGTFWCDTYGGDTLRKEQMLVAAERAMRSHKSIRRLRTPSWEQEFNGILVGIKKRKTSEIYEPEDARNFLRERQQFLHLSARLRQALRRLPPAGDRALLIYLTHIHDNMNACSYHSAG